MPKILVVHARGGVGDVVLSTPVIDALHAGIADAHITTMVRAGAAAIVEHHPHVTDHMVVPDGTWDRNPYYRTLLADLRRRQFDVGLVLWSQSPEAWLLRLAGIPVRVGQAGRVFYSFLYTHPVSIASEHGDTTTHWSAIQLGYAHALGLPVEGFAPTFVVPPGTAGPVTSLPGGPLLGFSVGKGLAITPQRWPVAAFAALADALSMAFGATIVLTGSPAERPVSAAVAAAMQGSHVDVAGQTTLLELGAVMQRCMAFVCPDSGPMHMAAALGVPTVGIFAMRCEFPDRWHPFGPHTAMVRPQPVTCPTHCRKETCEEAFKCYQAVAPAELVAKVRQVIGPQVRS